MASVRDRLLVVGLALLILVLRFPATFIRPELWAEDSMLVSDAYNNGWASLVEPLGGAYFNFYGSLVAKMAVQFTGAWWPWICIYAAHFATLLTVFLVTSPRFQLPYKTIAALVVVATPASAENILAALANAQWILPLGLVVLLFSRASLRPSVLVLELVFVGVVGLEGPLGCFLLPMYLYRSWATEGAERRRLVLLTGVLTLASIAQIASVAVSPNIFNLITPVEYDPLLWITIPLRWLDAVRVFLPLRNHTALCAVIAVAGGAGIVWYSLQTPYRAMKLTMLIFAAVILYSGMYKYRAHLNFIGNNRYVYAGAVFFFWFLCIWAAASNIIRSAILAGSLLLICFNVVVRVHESREIAAAPWSEFSARIGTGPLSIPIAPAGWNVTLNR